MAEQNGAEPQVEQGHDDCRAPGKRMSITRSIVILPACALFGMAIVLSVITTVEVARVVVEVLEGHLLVTDLSIEFVEFTDVFLLSVVLYMTSVGLFKLFVTERIPLPRWLDFNDLDDLKERLVSVVVVMLGVYFLGEVMGGMHGLDLLYLGISIAAVIVALTMFTKLVFHRHE